MKKRSILITILCVLSCFALMFTACESDETPQEAATAEATQTVTAEATNEATAEATKEATNEATAEATDGVAETATGEATENATETTETATGETTEITTEVATAEATEVTTETTTETATQLATSTPKATANTTATSTQKATATPTAKPTTVPTKAPTSKPTATPKPTAKPTKAPTAKPTATAVPTKAPTAKPTVAPAPTAISGETYTRDGNYIYFGTYPQGEVTDSSLKSTLNGLAGTLPTSSNNQAWTSYNYYMGDGRNGSQSNTTDFMWYKDVSYGGEKYRGVYFTSYRPYWTDGESAYTQQDSNGYSTGTVYWFKYEPIKWKILTENNGKAFLLCEMIIDSQAYQNCYTYDSQDDKYYATDDNGNILTDGASKVYANNYEYSTIRAWLNNDFYNTAFNSLQKQIIQLTTVDNSVASTGYSSNQYACDNTQDKVFLLSDAEFDEYITSGAEGEKKTTAYAQCQGAYTYSGGSYDGNGWWWLRSPYYYYSYIARGVDCDGHALVNDVDDSNNGVSPALWITL